MRIVFLVALVALSVLEVSGSPVSNTSETIETYFPGRICVKAERLEFEKYFMEHDKPEVPADACSDDISVYLARGAMLTACFQGYARHSNGRCYKIVDAPQNGGVVEKHEYRITYRGECGSLTTEVLASDLASDNTLDFCDEDGGCVRRGEAEADEEVRGISPLHVCAKGYVRSNGQCVKAFKTLTHSGNNNPKTNGR